MKTKANILIEDGQNIKANGIDTNLIISDSIDTPLISSSQYYLLSFDVDNDALNIGYGSNVLDLISINATAIALMTEDYDVHGGLLINKRGLKLLNYTTALRPTISIEGSIIYDSTLKKCILYNGTAWVNLDGTALS